MALKKANNTIKKKVIAIKKSEITKKQRTGTIGYLHENQVYYLNSGCWTWIIFTWIIFNMVDPICAQQIAPFVLQK